MRELVSSSTLSVPSLLRLWKETDACRCYLFPLLPLVAGNVEAAGPGRSYFVPEWNLLAMEAADPELMRLFLDRPAVQLRHRDGRRMLGLGFASRWAEDLQHFAAGRYSQFSPEARERIREFSGFAADVEHEGQVLTDFRLLALDRAPVLQTLWREFLYDDAEYSPLDSGTLELLPAPDASFFLPPADLSFTEGCLQDLQRPYRYVFSPEELGYG